jgi:RNA methyltransferase, TrmH family
MSTRQQASDFSHMTTRKGGPVDDGAALASVRTGRVVAARRLTRASVRRTEGLFLAEGPQAVREALNADGVVIEVFLTPEAGDRHPQILERANDTGVRLVWSGDEAVASLSGSATPQGIVAVCRSQRPQLDEILALKPRLVVALVHARDPGNVGSVLRVADAAGADAVVITRESVDVTNDKVVRSSTGSLFHLPIVTDVDTQELIDAARASGLQILVADSGGEDLDALMDAGVLSTPTLWVFGNEAWGVPSEVLQSADRVVSVPIHGRAESLNLATAAAVCLYSSARAMRIGSTSRS